MESAALSLAMTTADDTTAAKRGALKGVVAAAGLQERLGIKLHEILDALSEGTPYTGDKLLLKVLCVMTRYLSSWGVLALLAFSIYQLANKASGLASKLWSYVKQAAAVFAPISGLRETAGKLFHDATSEADPAIAAGVVATMISAEVPLFGTLIALIPSSLSDAGSPLPIDFSNNMRQLNDMDVDDDDDDDDEDEDLDVSATIFQAAKRLGVDPIALGREVSNLLSNDDDSDEDEFDQAYDELEDALEYADVAY
jgi:hypothetical protein